METLLWLAELVSDDLDGAFGDLEDGFGRLGEVFHGLVDVFGRWDESSDDLDNACGRLDVASDDLGDACGDLDGAFHDLDEASDDLGSAFDELDEPGRDADDVFCGRESAFGGDFGPLGTRNNPRSVANLLGQVVALSSGCVVRARIC